MCPSRACAAFLACRAPARPPPCSQPRYSLPPQVSCSWGYTTSGGAKGVGESTTSAVVSGHCCAWHRRARTCLASGLPPVQVCCSAVLCCLLVRVPCSRGGACWLSRWLCQAELVFRDSAASELPGAPPWLVGYLAGPHLCHRLHTLLHLLPGRDTDVFPLTFSAFVPFSSPTPKSRQGAGRPCISRFAFRLLPTPRPLPARSDPFFCAPAAFPSCELPAPSAMRATRAVGACRASCLAASALLGAGGRRGGCCCPGALHPACTTLCLSVLTELLRQPSAGRAYVAYAPARPPACRARGMPSGHALGDRPERTRRLGRRNAMPRAGACLLVRNLH